MSPKQPEKLYPKVQFDYDNVEPKPATEPPLPTSYAAQNHVPNPYMNTNLTHEKIAAIRAKASIKDINIELRRLRSMMSTTMIVMRIC